MLFALLGIVLLFNLGLDFKELTSGLADGSSSYAQIIFDVITNALDKVLFYPLFGRMPFLVAWLFIAGIFFTLYMGFPNIRMFGHGILVACGKYSSKKDRGQITPRQAAMTAISGTVGLGNIAGVAIAVGIGGPGAVLWMVLMGFLGMSVIFSEAIASQKYRCIDKSGTVFGGPFRYLKYGLKDVGLFKFGKVLAFVFTVFFIFGAIGTPLFQSHEMVSSLTSSFEPLRNSGVIISTVVTLFTLIIMIGGIERISKVTQVLVPIMAVTYVGCCLTIIVYNFENFFSAIAIIFQDAIGLKQVGAGFIGTMVMGVRRAAFSNEAGLGTSPIAHAAAKSLYPTRQASVACLTPFVDTIIVCFLTGIVITITGAYQMNGDGVVMTQNAFSTVSSWFPKVLSFSIALFAVSTILSYGYYGKNAWITIFGKKTQNIYIFFFCLCVFIAGEINFSTVVKLSENLTLSIAIPNLIGMYLISKIVKKEYKEYFAKLRSGKFESEE
jgi:AGCS family alanine or glycine:cation symporter